MMPTSEISRLLLHNLFSCSTWVDQRRRLWDQGRSLLVLGDSNCWRGSNNYYGLLTRSIYSTVWFHYRDSFWNFFAGKSILFRQCSFENCSVEHSWHVQVIHFNPRLRFQNTEYIKLNWLNDTNYIEKYFFILFY